ncbi:MAG: soluble cytochrome b562 [Chlamydiales bacterium]|jgi:soluble cytochrome b562
MKLSQSLAYLLLPLFLGAASLSSAAPLPLADEHEEEHEEGPVEEAMEGLHTGLRRLRALAKGTDGRDEALEVLRNMQAAALSAFPLEPPTLDDREVLEGDEHDIWVAEYRQHIIRLVDKLLEMELQVLRGRMDLLQAGYSELSEIRNTAHHDYQ